MKNRSLLQKITSFLTLNRNKKEIFLLGFYISFLFVMSLASGLDYMIGNYVDAIIEVIFILPTLASLGYYKYSKDTNIAIYSIVILATLTTYALLISNDFNLSIFHTIVPLGYFLLFSLKRSLMYTLVHQVIVISIYIYGYHYYPEHDVLHDTALLVATVMASLIIILFGTFYHLAVENSYTQLAKSNAKKEILLKEVHHRVKNNLNIVSSLLGLQQLEQKDPIISEMLKKNRLRIDSIAIVHELLYKHEDFEKIDIYDYIKQLTHIVSNMYHEEIDVNIQSNHVALPFDMTLKIGIITNELLINSFKHAFSNDKGKVEISFITTKDEYLYIYKDNGKISIEEKELLKNDSLGYKLITIMVEQMEGELDIHSNDGLVYTIRIPHE